MKILSVLLVVLLNFTCILQVFAERCYVLTQKTQSTGDSYLYVAQNGLKYYLPARKFGVVTSAPSWTLNLYNDKTKKYFATTVDKFKGNFAANVATLEGQTNGGNWIKRANTTICGLMAAEYVLKTNSAPTFKKVINGHPVNIAAIQEIHYWVCEQVPINPVITKLLTRLYGLPALNYLPLKLIYYKTGQNKPILVLDTYRINQYNTNNNYFQIASGYQAVKNESMVILDDEDQQMLKDMAGDLGVNENSLINSLSK